MILLPKWNLKVFKEILILLKKNKEISKINTLIFSKIAFFAKK